MEKGEYLQGKSGIKYTKARWIAPAGLFLYSDVPMVRRLAALRAVAPQAHSFLSCQKRMGRKEALKTRNSADAPKKPCCSSSAFYRYTSRSQNALRAARRISLIWNVEVRRIFDVWKSIGRTVSKFAFAADFRENVAFARADSSPFALHVGGDAHIAPAELHAFTVSFGEFVVPTRADVGIGPYIQERRLLADSPQTSEKMLLSRGRAEPSAPTIESDNLL